MQTLVELQPTASSVSRPLHSEADPAHFFLGTSGCRFTPGPPSLPESRTGFSLSITSTGGAFMNRGEGRFTPTPDVAMVTIRSPSTTAATILLNNADDA